MKQYKLVLQYKNQPEKNVLFYGSLTDCESFKLQWITEHPNYADYGKLSIS